MRPRFSGWRFCGGGRFFTLDGKLPIFSDLAKMIRPEQVTMPRRIRTDPEYVQTLEQRANNAMRKFRAAMSAQKEQSRADDARRKIIGGALCENHALANRGSDFAKVYSGLLKDYVRPEDRWLFGDVFRALLPSAEAEKLLAEGETARLTAERARRDAKANGANPGQTLTDADPPHPASPAADMARR
jgi:hypothetical protein